MVLFVGEPWKEKRISDLHLQKLKDQELLRNEELNISQGQGLFLSALMIQMALIYAWTALAKCEPKVAKWRDAFKKLYLIQT